MVIIKGTKLLIDPGYFIILMSIKNILIILQREVMIGFLKIRLEPIFDICLDLADSILNVLYLQLIFRHINIEFLQVRGNTLDLLFDVVFFMI